MIFFVGLVSLLKPSIPLIRGFNHYTIIQVLELERYAEANQHKQISHKKTIQKTKHENFTCFSKCNVRPHATTKVFGLSLVHILQCDQSILYI